MLVQRAVAVQAAQQTATGASYASALAGGTQQMASLQMQPVATSSNSAPQASTWALQPHRPMRSIATTVQPLANLPGILDAEIKHEKENYAKPEAASVGPPAPFTLSETPGDTMLSLSRKFNNEQISVDLVSDGALCSN